MQADILTLTPQGLYCPPGDFYIDPWRTVERAVITHAHGDHARWGMQHYLCSRPCEGLLRVRIGAGASIQPLEYGDVLTLGDVKLSFHPAGHILGSAQVRLEHRGYVAVISGDYKVSPDDTCAPFELQRCHLFVTESTFGLPIYRWRPQHEVFAEINQWWAQNQSAGRASLLMGYSLGKAQRLLAGVDRTLGPIYSHGSVEPLSAVYREQGIDLPNTLSATAEGRKADFSQALIVAPPSVQGTPWVRRFGDVSEAFASGWMTIRGARRRRAIDRGFTLSDHADWPELLTTIQQTGAERVLVTHGYSATLVRYLNARGQSAGVLETEFRAEPDDDEALTPGVASS